MKRTPRVLDPNYLNGVRPVVRREVNSVDLGIYSGVKYDRVPVLPALGLHTLVPKPQHLIPSAIQQSPLRKVLGVKGEPDRIRVGKAILTRPLDGIRVHTGYARHQHIGLAYDPNKPITGPLMPIASSVYGGMNSDLGQPPG